LRGREPGPHVGLGRETACGVTRIDEAPVDADVELSRRAGPYVKGLNAARFKKGPHPERLRLIISTRAIVNADVHMVSPKRGESGVAGAIQNDVSGAQLQYDKCAFTRDD
jgi:hypothetical protein